MFTSPKKTRVAGFTARLLVSACLFSAATGAALAQDDDDYRKATEGKDVVKNKIYPKEHKIEFSLPNVGLILNQSYVNTFLVGGGVGYYFSETWGIGLDVAMGMNSDKPERTCIESFYNDPNDEVTEPCGDSGNLQGKANYGPAYVPIREIKYMGMLNLIWNPVYGKQLIMLSTTSYFDLFFEFGAGVVMSDYYGERKKLANGNQSRGVFNETKGDYDVPTGASASETNSYGKEGRPDPESTMNPMINIGVGQKFHFGGSMFVKLYLRDMILLGTPKGFENLLSLSAGLGLRF